MSSRMMCALYVLASFAACKAQTTTESTDAAPSVATVTTASATASAPPAASVTKPMTPPPADWWTATPTAGNEKTPGSIHFSASEIAFVTKLGEVRMHDAKLLSGDAAHWEWNEHEVGGEVRCTLDQDATTARATFQCSAGTRTQAYALAPLTDGARRKGLDAAVEKSRPPKDVCVVAEACGTKVFAQGSQPAIFDADTELGNPRSPQKCKKALVGLRAMAGLPGRTMPPECL